MTKRYVSIIALSLCIVGMPTFCFAQKIDAEGNQLIEAPFTSVPPTIDGIISPGEWSAAESNTVDYVNLGVAGSGAMLLT